MLTSYYTSNNAWLRKCSIFPQKVRKLQEIFKEHFMEKAFMNSIMDLCKVNLSSLISEFSNLKKGI